MGADKRTLVTLDTVFFEPFGYESCHTAFFESCGALFPGTVLTTGEGADLEEVAILGVDGTNDVVDECGIVVGCGCFSFEVAPSLVDRELLVFATAINSCVVLVDDILALLAVRLNDEFLHLLNCEVNGDYFGDAEECALEDGVGTVAEADFLSDLGCVDVVNGDIVVSEILLDLVGEILGEFLSFPDGVEKE